MISNPDPALLEDQASSSSLLDFSYIGALLLRRLWLIALCFLTVLLLAIGYVLTATPVYEATAVVQVEQEEQKSFTTGDDPAQDLRSEEILRTIEQNLQSHALFEDVVRSPDLNSDPMFLPGLVQRGEKSVAFATLADRLKSLTRVSLKRGTRLISITVMHPVPEMAQKLAQKIVDEFVVESAEEQTSTTRSSMQFLVTESDRLKVNLQKSENALQIYKEALVLKDRIDDQQRVIDSLQQRYRDKHPELIQARALMADLLQKFDLELKKVLANSKDEEAYWESNDASLTDTSWDTHVASELKLVEARTNVLQREVDTESALFDNVLKQMREADVSDKSAPTEIRMVEPPLLPLVPSAPHKKIILMIAGLFGIFIGVALVLLLNALDNSVKTATEAEELFHLPVLATIPRLSRSEKKKRTVRQLTEGSPEAVPVENPEGLVLLNNASGTVAESLRSLRATLSLLGKVEDRRTILFTSAFPDEGKTFVSSNFAVSLAHQGLRTLLIDTDLRRPAVSGLFKIENSVGLVEHITQGLDLRDAVHSNVVDNLDIMTAGARCANPAELLSGTGFAETIKGALMTYDRVVIDCSPVLLVSDTLLVAPCVQTVCLVVRTAKTSRRAVKQAISSLQRANSRPVGIILNFAPEWSNHMAYSPYGYQSKEAEKYRDIYS